MKKRRRIKPAPLSKDQAAVAPVAPQRQVVTASPWLLLGPVLVVIFIAFSPCLQAEFQKYDDEIHVWSNRAVQAITPENLKRIFTSTVFNTYVPLTLVSFAIEHHFVALTPFLYHLDNVLLHLVVVTLIFFLGRRLGLPPLAAALAAMIFGIHPMRVEPVAWVSGRKDVLYSVFYLLSVHFYIDYIERRSWKRYSLSLLMGFLSILAKPMALSLPLVLFLFDWFYSRKFDRRVWIEKIPYFAYIVPIAFITFIPHANPPKVPLQESSAFWIWTFMFYLRKFFLPADLTVLYQWPKPISWFQPDYLLSGSLCVLWLGALWYFRRNRWFIFASLYYVLSIFFQMRFDDQIFKNLVADRFMYLPSLGFCLWIGLILGQCWEKWKSQAPARAVYIGAVGLVCLLYGLLSFLQCRIWKNDVTMWDYTMKSHPDARSQYTNLGIYYLDRNNDQRAVHFFKKAMEVDPNDFTIYNNLGLLYLRASDHEAALREFDRAIALNPHSAESYNNRGLVHMKRGQVKQAFSDFSKCIELKPGLFSAYVSRSDIHMTRGHYSEAAADLTAAIRFSPDNPSLYVQRARVYVFQKDLPKARDDYARILQLDPNDQAARKSVYEIQALLREKRPDPIPDQQ